MEATGNDSIESLKRSYQLGTVDRREFLGALVLLGVSAPAAYAMAEECKPPSLDPTAPLAKYWNEPVSKVACPEPVSLTPEEAERHYLYSLLVMALIYRFWNGNKYGQEGDYPWRPKQKRANGIYEGGQYLGHNIACIAVDGCGEIIDFDFNHNEIFNSSVEHAESRLVRRIFSLAQLSDGWNVRKADETAKSSYYATSLNNVTIFTSLESCAQCSGIMALGTVKAVVYLQRDPGTYSIGNIMRNLTSPSLRAPLPISGDNFAFSYFSKLNDGYEKFFKSVAQKPFYKNGAEQIKTQSITSFLCTDDAREVFAVAFEEFDKTFKPRYPAFRPSNCSSGGTRDLTNAEVQERTRAFFRYASNCSRRGTPHKL
jgi:tRNA(Arg) A34 adenosine deaminase TadA